MQLPLLQPIERLVVFAAKRGSTLRLCMYYRRLNSMTMRNAYLISRMDKCIDSLGDAKDLSTLDQNSGY